MSRYHSLPNKHITYLIFHFNFDSTIRPMEHDRSKYCRLLKCLTHLLILVGKIFLNIYVDIYKIENNNDNITKTKCYNAWYAH